ncbi:putative agamous-like MADS-box protein AGL65 [Cocos nucifera]|nr:putative agamous-like MADS-box protein AGL65 [Cocos nucifera]
MFSSDEHKSELWAPLAHQGWRPCIESANNPVPLPAESTGYIQVFLDGGLNQQRMGICDAVAVAKILNATLVIPHLEVNPVWKDSSSFEEIYDVDHFISVLKDEISVVRELPQEFSWSTREYYAVAIRATRVKTAPVHASANWYLENVLPILQRCSVWLVMEMTKITIMIYLGPLILEVSSFVVFVLWIATFLFIKKKIESLSIQVSEFYAVSYGIAAIAPFSHRLAFDNLPGEIQRLRCKVNFRALVFVPHINALGEALVKRLRYPVSIHSDEYIREVVDENVHVASGKFVVLHLRFDKDMAAHSACDFGGGKAERLALAKYRQVIWQGRVLNSQFTDEELRSQGRCPLTPEEIGLLLAAFGFDSKTRLYLASHKVYGGEARISSLRKLFPLMEDKKSLASEEELAKVEGKASLLAAVDYYVSMSSDVFISASPGNMHNAVVGHRTHLNLKTIRPNMALLGQLFLNKSMECNIEDVVAKFAQLTPQERAKRKLESLEALKKTFKKLDHDVNIQEFLGASAQTVEILTLLLAQELTNHSRLLQAQISEVQKRLSYWSEPEKINSIDHIRAMEESLKHSLNQVQLHKFQDGIHLPLEIGGEQQSSNISWLHDNEGQPMMLPEESNLPPQRECSTEVSLQGFPGYFSTGKETEADEQINDDTLNQLGQNACLGLQLAGHYPYRSYGLNLLHEKKFKPQAEVNLQEATVEYQMNSFEPPRPRYDASIQTWASTSGSCGVTVFANHSYCQTMHSDNIKHKKQYGIKSNKSF